MAGRGWITIQVSKLTSSLSSALFGRFENFQLVEFITLIFGAMFASSL